MPDTDENIIDLSYKDLSAVPNDILHKSNLRRLYLEGNNIEILPESFFKNMNTLVWLDLRNNKLKFIPKSIENHPCLETLLLDNNNIETLPVELGLVQNLKILHLSGNPLTYPVHAIINGGIKMIRNHLLTEYNRLNNREEVEEMITNEVFKMGMNQSRKFKEGKKPLHFYKQSETKVLPSEIRNEYSKYRIYKDKPYHNSNKYLIKRRRNELRVLDVSRKELWTHRLKRIMTIQDSHIQRQKNFKAMKTWRNKSKFNKEVNLSYKPDLPYGHYSEYERMPSRNELQSNVNDAKKPNPRNQHTKVDVNEMISDVLGALKQLDIDRKEPQTPKTQMNSAEQEIKRIAELQKRLSSLKIRNNQSI